MLSDEEKKAIEKFKNFIYTCQDVIEDEYSDYEEKESAKEYQEVSEKILNLIEKQSKEIEHQKEKRENQKKELAILNAKQIEFNKLVNTINSYKGQFKRQQKEIEEYKKDIHKEHELAYAQGNYDTTEYWKDKIKAKIEEIEEILNGQLIEKLRVYFEAQKEVLQSLLEKE